MPYITSIERLGRKEGQVDLVLRQLRRRCGALSSATELRVRGLTSRRVAALAEALLDFTGPADLDAGSKTAEYRGLAHVSPGA